MLRWDGTEITHLLEEDNVFIEETIYGDNIYYRIVFKNKNNDNPILSIPVSPSSNVSDKGKEEMYNYTIDDEENIGEIEEIEEGNGEGNEMEEIEQIEQEPFEEETQNVGIVRTSTTSYPCLIDEIKPVFGLHKVGTHWFWQNGKIMILQKARISDGKVIQEIHLNDLTYHHERLEYEVRKIFTFRELLGMTKNHESSIILREFEDRIIPISFYEPGMDPTHKGKVIPETVLKTWFKNITIDISVKKLLDVQDYSDMTKKLAEIRKYLEEVVNRVDKEQITFVDEILTRIRKRLQYIL